MKKINLEELKAKADDKKQPMTELKQLRKLEDVKASIDKLYSLLNNEEKFDYKKLYSQLDLLNQAIDLSPQLKEIEKAVRDGAKAKPIAIDKFADLLEAVKSNKPLDNKIDLTTLEKGLNKLSKTIEKQTLKSDQTPEKFIPVRRVVWIGNRYIFDDGLTGSNASGGGGSSSGSSSGNVVITDAGGEAATVTGGKLDVNATASLSGDAVPVSGAATAVSVQIVDGSGNQVASFGGGTQYTEGDTDATITGTALMLESAGNGLVAAPGSGADGQLVNLGTNNDVTVTSGTITANLGATDNQVLDNIEAGIDELKTGVVLAAGTNAVGKLAANSGVDIGDVDVTSLPALPTGTNYIGKISPPDVDVTTHTNYAKKYYTNAGAVTDGVVWSPAAGKRWHVCFMYINVSAAATVTLEDDLGAGDSPVWKAELAANSGIAVPFPEKYPLASGEDAADLLITTSAGNVYCTITGYEI